MRGKDHFSTDYIYHIYNKTIDLFTPFGKDYYVERFIDLAWYYRSSKCRISYSKYIQAPEEIQDRLKKNINLSSNFQVDILAYCIMPNHYHFLLKQTKDKGISKYMNNISNAITRYFNLIKRRKGPLFIPRYKSRLIQTEEQLIHVSRYIHLNPYSAGIVKTYEDLFNYKYSSLKEYFNKKTLVNTDYILNTGYFLNNKNKYASFIKNHADYQRSLEYIKHVGKWQ